MRKTDSVDAQIRIEPDGSPLVQAGVGIGAPRHCPRAPRLRAVATTALLGALGACGGGGGAGGGPAPPPPPPTSSGPLDPQLSVPTPVGYDADRLAAFDRLNEIRLSAGLGMLAQHPLLDRAAQAHAEWEIANNSLTHVEAVGSTGFTGAHWWDRDEALGYVPLGGEEVLSSGAHARQGVDALVNAVYHRAGILAFEPVDVGIGWTALVASNVSFPLVIDITTPGGDLRRHLGQLAQPSIGGAAIWPLDAASGVPTRMGAESPDPVPGVDVLALGTPPSITVANTQSISATSFVLAKQSSGAVVPTAILGNLNDPNALIPPSYVAAIPLAALEPDTQYTVAFSGNVSDLLSGASSALSRSWSFTTGPD